jgi:glycosyltransferase involved in cell wall biosynthesis
MTRVVEVLATLKRAGAERMVVALARGLDRERFAPTVISLFDAFPGGFEPELEAAGVPVRHLAKRPGMDARIWPRLARDLRALQPDIVHTHSYVMRYVLPAWLLAGRPGRLVHTVHNLALKEVEWRGRLLHRVAFGLGVVPVAVSGEVAASFESVYGSAPAVIPNGVDTEACCRPEPWRRQNGIGERDLVVVSVARLDRQKNPLALARAFERIGTGTLLVAGEGELRPQLEARERVRLLGVRRDTPELLAAADVFALASDWEGHPLALMEAMAAGLPVVATRVGGVEEIVGDAGLLVPAGDEEDLTRALRQLMEDPELRRRLGQAARERSRRFGLRPMIESYQRLFERVSG